MGRSMSNVSASLLTRVPTSAKIFDEHLNRHFELYVRQGNLYQTEYEVTADGKEAFRDTQKVEWIIGAGANGLGAIVRRDNYLYEAPLSYYSRIPGWALSPGYELADYGFNRPIQPACVACHSGQPRPVWDGNGRFREPAFAELAIGCENCHGPGAAHVREKQTGATQELGASSIVNPAKLTPWLADNICMSCHQTGQARVVQEGKHYRDFRPGTALDKTLSIFRVPFGQGSVPQDDLLEHYFSMRLSRCYRASAGQLRCISCHNPHVQPTQERAPGYFRQRCLTCHAETSCTAPKEARQRTAPADNCVGCHMPKREVKEISHSVLTNHRIVRTPGDPFPDAAFQMTTPQLPDLIHLSAVPGSADAPPPLVLLQAYRQVMFSHPEYRERYWSVAKELQASHPEDIAVLEALADFSLHQRTPEGAAAAIRYLDRARSRGSTEPADFEQLAALLIATDHESEAISVLQQGISVVPYDADLYRLLARTYLALKREREGCAVLTQANRIFPQDVDLRGMRQPCKAAKPPASRR
jgi:hypothetical protein